MDRRAKYVAWTAGLSLAYFSFAYWYLFTGGCVGKRSPLELIELCRLVGAPLN